MISLEGADYLGPDKPSTFGGVLTDLSSFMVIFNYIIPISLYVTLGTNDYVLSNMTFCNATVMKFRNAKILGNFLLHLGCRALLL